MNHAIDLAVGCRYFLPACGYLRSFHQMALPVNGSTHLIPALLFIYRPRKDERLSWPRWLTCSGWLTHISGHPSAAGRAQDRESSPVRDRRSITVPRQRTNIALLFRWVSAAADEPARRAVSHPRCCIEKRIVFFTAQLICFLYDWELELYLLYCIG